MNETPKIIEQIGGYILEWTSPSLLAQVGRIVVHSDGRVTGELQLTNGKKEKPTILLPSTQFNFSAERTRSQFAKQLKEKFPSSQINWIELFDYLGHKIQELARTGEPVEEIWTEEEIHPPEFLLTPFIIKGVNNIIFGEKGVNKSTLAYTFAACMKLPWYDNPLGLDVPDNPVHSLILDWETDKYNFQYYISRMKRGMNVTFSLNYRRCRLPLAEELEPIERYIKETRADVLIIDSLAAAAGGEQAELKGSQSALQFNTALRKLGKTALIIAQTSKNPETHKKTIYGSTLFTYYSRNIFEVCGSEDDLSDTKHIAIFHRESNLTRKHPPIGFALTFDEEKHSLKIERESVDVSEFAQKVASRTRILEVLKHGSLTTKEIAENLDMKLGSTAVIIQRLKRQGRVIKVGEGWGLSNED